MMVVVIQNKSINSMIRGHQIQGSLGNEKLRAEEEDSRKTRLRGETQEYKHIGLPLNLWIFCEPRRRAYTSPPSCTFHTFIELHENGKFATILVLRSLVNQFHSSYLFLIEIICNRETVLKVPNSLGFT